MPFFLYLYMLYSKDWTIFTKGIIYGYYGKKGILSKDNLFMVKEG